MIWNLRLCTFECFLDWVPLCLPFELEIRYYVGLRPWLVLTRVPGYNDCTLKGDYLVVCVMCFLLNGWVVLLAFMRMTSTLGMFCFWKWEKRAVLRILNGFVRNSTSLNSEGARYYF